MVSPFAAADDLSSAAVSLVYGERVRLLPWRSGGAWVMGGPDPDRPPTDMTVVLSGAVGDQNLSGDTGGTGGAGFLANATTRDRRISVDNAAWPPYAAVGDRVQALEQPGAPTYEITSIVPDTMNRTWANLSAVVTP